MKGIVHGLTLDRYSDSEIVQYLKDHHNISIERSTVYKIRKRIEKESKSWYEQLRQSDYKYIYTYKERIDSLNRYQHKLIQIMNKEETSDFLRIQAIYGQKSLLVCLPIEFTHYLGITKGDYVKCSVRDNQLIVEKAEV